MSVAGPTAHWAVRDMPGPVLRQLEGPSPGETGLVELEEQPHKGLHPPLCLASPCGSQKAVPLLCSGLAICPPKTLVISGVIRPGHRGRPLVSGPRPWDPETGWHGEAEGACS